MGPALSPFLSRPRVLWQGAGGTVSRFSFWGSTGRSAAPQETLATAAAGTRMIASGDAARSPTRMSRTSSQGPCLHGDMRILKHCVYAAVCSRILLPLSSHLSPWSPSNCCCVKGHLARLASRSKASACPSRRASRALRGSRAKGPTNSLA